MFKNLQFFSLAYYKSKSMSKTNTITNTLQKEKMQLLKLKSNRYIWNEQISKFFDKEKYLTNDFPMAFIFL